MEKIFKEKNAITLAALVVAAVLLAILAGISISSLTGKEGMLKKTEYAALMQEIARNRRRSKFNIFT